MFGGGSVTMPEPSPSDITVRGNHITRPASWKGVWQAKNLIESKHARRLLIEGNVIENEWQDAQAGFAFVLKSENQNGDNAVDPDHRRHDPLQQDPERRQRLQPRRQPVAANPAVPAARFVITDNVVENVNTESLRRRGSTLPAPVGSLRRRGDAQHHGERERLQPGHHRLRRRRRISRLVMHSNILHHGCVRA